MKIARKQIIFDAIRFYAGNHDELRGFVSALNVGATITFNGTVGIIAEEDGAILTVQEGDWILYHRDKGFSDETHEMIEAQFMPLTPPQPHPSKEGQPDGK